MSILTSDLNREDLGLISQAWPYRLTVGHQLFELSIGVRVSVGLLKIFMSKTLKFKIKRQPIPPNMQNGIVYSGMEVLKVRKGTILKVLENSTANDGDFIIRTDNDQSPFRTVLPNILDKRNNRTGKHWGNGLSEYLFESCPHLSVLDFPEFMKVL